MFNEKFLESPTLGFSGFPACVVKSSSASLEGTLESHMGAAVSSIPMYSAGESPDAKVTSRVKSVE